MTRFQNFARTVACTPRLRHSVQSVDDLSQVLSQAEASGQKVRTIGAGHSFTALAETEDILLDLDGYQGIEEVDALTHEVTFRAGTRLWQIPALLRPFGLALENMGDIDRQSIAGAVSTSTHGTGLKYTGFSGAVTGLSLMLADGSWIRCSATENSRLFEAARVGLGAVGVLTHVRMRCVPHYMMQAEERIEPIEQVVEGFIERAHHEDHLEFFWFPGADQAQVKINTRLPADAPSRTAGKLSQWVNDELLSNLGLQAVCSAAALKPQFNAALGRFATSMLSNRSYTAPWHQVYATSRRVRFNEMEYALPIESFGSALQEIRRYFASKALPVVFPLEVRTAAADDTWLGTASGRTSVYIAVHHYIKEKPADYFSDMEAIFSEHDGRPHWGKMHSLTAVALAGLYPRFSDFQEVRAEVDPQRRFINSYLGKLLDLAEIQA